MNTDVVAMRGFVWNLDILGLDGEPILSETNHNIIPSDGLNFLIRSPFGDVMPVTKFYLGLFRGNYVPSPSTSAADIPGNMIEMVDFSETSRPEWDRAFSGTASMDNLDSKAEFTITQDRTIYGAFLVSDATKGGNNGLLLSCVRFPTPKQVTAGQIVKLSGGLTYSSTNIL